MYLAGYAVECMLKALLLAGLPRPKQRATALLFRGRVGHDFEWLKKEMRRRGLTTPKGYANHFVVVNSWTTDLRYSGGHAGAQETRDFLKSVAVIMAWVERSL
jgi:hypothetical protein